MVKKLEIRSEFARTLRFILRSRVILDTLMYSYYQWRRLTFLIGTVVLSEEDSWCVTELGV